MKNYVVWRCHSLFQHLPAVLDEDVASVAVGTADVRIVMRYVLRGTMAYFGVRRAHKDRIFAVYCLQNVAP